MGELRTLTESECRAHLAQHRTGRVAVVAPDGPHIIPVSYALVDEQVIFRTSPTTLLAAHGPGAVLAFEVERTDGASRSGWSVVARGPADLLLDTREIDHVRRVWEPVPWADGDRDLYLRLSVRELTGRSVGAPFPTRAALTDGPDGWGLLDGGRGPFASEG